ncbi:uncharacterized protein [Ciconia boyciana]|uniref:uncharacterized protein n=1 Tax=Ciconia boyciana TaxID=52775 RepID=UPI003BA041FC
MATLLTLFTLLTLLTWEDVGQHCAPPPLPPVTVTSFSGTIRLYRSAVGGSPPPPPGKPLLLLLPWLGAREGGLARYLALYLRRGVDVLVVGTRTCHVLRPRQGQRLAGRLLRLLDHGGDGGTGGGGGGGTGGDGNDGDNGGGNGGGGTGGDNGGSGGTGGDGGGKGGGGTGGDNGGSGGGGGNGGSNGGGTGGDNSGSGGAGGGGNGGSNDGGTGGGGGTSGGGAGLATRPLLVHAISAGAYTFAQVLLLLRRRPRQCQRLAPRFRGIVYDSLVTGGFGDMARGIASTVGTPSLRAAARVGARLYLGVLGWRGELERARGAFASPPLRCPLLLFYSLDDGLSRPAALRALLRGWRAQGIRAHARGWPRSRHAAHLRQHPADYRRALLAFLRSLDGPPPPRPRPAGQTDGEPAPDREAVARRGAALPPRPESSRGLRRRRGDGAVPGGATPRRGAQSRAHGARSTRAAACEPVPAGDAVAEVTRLSPGCAEPRHGV